MDTQSYPKHEVLRCEVCAKLLTDDEVRAIQRDTDFISHDGHLIRVVRKSRFCNDPEHEARRAELAADKLYGTPCLVCGAPILDGYGHDKGCMAADRICNECGAQLPRETESGSPLLMAHIRAEHPERLTVPLSMRLQDQVSGAFGGDESGNRGIR